MGPLVIFVPHLDGATGYFESWLYGAMAYSGVRFQRGQRLCWSTPVRGHELYLVFTGLFHSENTGPWQISNTGLKIISVGDFNGAMDNFLSSGYGAIRFLGCLNQRGHSKSRHRSPLISRSRIPINIDSSLRYLPWARIFTKLFRWIYFKTASIPGLHYFVLWPWKRLLMNSSNQRISP